MTPERLNEIEARAKQAPPDARSVSDVILALVAEVRRLQDAQQAVWSDGFAAGEQSNEDVAKLRRKK